MSNTQEIHALASRHLGDTDGSPKTLLRRLDDKMQKQEARIERLDKQVGLAVTACETLRESLEMGGPERTQSLYDTLQST